MSKILRILLCLILFTPTYVSASQYVKPPEIKQNYEIPDLRAEANILLDRFKLLKKRADKLEQNKKVSGDVDDLLKNLFLPANPKEFKRFFERELTITRHPGRASLWLSMANNYMEQGNVKDAATTAWMAYRLDKSKYRKATALRVMGEAYIEQNKIADGLNIFQQSLILYQSDETKRRLRVIKERLFLTIRGISINKEQQSPGACITFSKKLDKSQKPEDYVSLKDISDVDISLNGNQICLAGLDFGKSYQVTIRRGLKSENNFILDQDSVRKFRVTDREGRASFDQDSYVISRTKDNSVPLTTVNMKKLKLELYLIHDRNLIHSYNFLNSIDQYNAADIRDDKGELIWQGSIDIEGQKNKESKTLVPLDEMITKKQNGIYVLMAYEEKAEKQRDWRYQSRNNATQWLLISDMGLLTLKGRDGLHVMVRSLKSAAPTKNVKVTLLARNNKILGTATSDKRGFAHFPMGLIRGKGGNAPTLITAEGKDQDYNFLKINDSQLDLSERGVTGRKAPGKQDAFLYTDRGVYRPGGTVRLSALLRDPESRAIGTLPLTFEVNKPDGSTLIEKTLTGDDLGGYAMDIPLSPAAIPGEYDVFVYLTDSNNSLGNVTFQVEDFVPRRIRAKLITDIKWLESQQKAELTLKANFLYGPPATGLKSETNVTLRRNPRPYPDYKSYHFGLVEDEFYRKSLPEITGKTNDQGEAVISLMMKDLPDTSQPLLAWLQSFVFDVSGRPVDAKIAIPLRPRAVEVGVKKAFEGDLDEGEEASFELIALDRQGQPMANRSLTYELVEEDYYYSWYRSGDYWNSRRHMSDSMVKTGEVITDKSGHAVLHQRTKDGRYRLTILDRDGSSAASLRYYVGWWSSGALPNVPDELELSLKDNSINDGKLLTAFVKAPFEGRATLMIINDQMRLSREITLPKEGREISIKVDKAWGPGAYLSVTAFRPDAGKPSRLPVRAMNLAWFSIDQDQRKAVIRIEVPDTVIPRQTITLPVSLTGQNVAGQKIRMTLAAVDEGILGLTNFQSPNPSAHYLAQRRLGMTFADLYGRLVKPVEGLRGKLRTGGDLAQMRLADTSYEEIVVTAEKRKDENASGVQTRTVKTVALYQRDITLDRQGKGVITLDLPDYNGRLRLMAVAYGANIIGQGSAKLTVRDPVVADLLLPRFLAPGDLAETTLSIHNLSGTRKSFTITLDHGDGLSFKSDRTLTVTLADGKRFEKVISLKAGKVGNSKLSLSVKAAGIPDITRHWDIAVRPAQPFISKRQVAYLARGDHEVISREDINGFLPGTIKTSLTLTDKPDYNVPDLLDSLYLYPYGCGEQTTSRALPLLYYGEVAETWNKDYDPLKMRGVIDKAIIRLLDLQKHDGSFALWYSTGKTHPWLTAYIFEFFSRAREQGLDVPKAAYAHAREWLRTYANDRGSSDPHVRAYALYVLARIGDIKPSVVRYFADNRGQDIETRIGLGHLGAALSLIGERQLSEEYFERAIRKTRPGGKYWVWYEDFGSDLRDGATLANLIAENTPDSKRQLRVAESLDREFDRRKYFSTQEKAWLLLATRALSKNSGQGFQVALNGQSLPKSEVALRYSLKPEAVLKGFDIENIGPPSIRAIQSIRAVPENPLKPTANGFQLSRRFYTLNGKQADLNNIKQNDMLVVVLQGRSTNRIDHEALIVDLLPAGFEIENAAVGGFEAGEELDFIPEKTSFLYEAMRDDRYVAAFNLNRYKQKFATSYIVRAITPGRYKLPAPFVEDMYKPQYHARGEVGTITIRK